MPKIYNGSAWLDFYTLPCATSSVLGGVKVGSNISVSSGVISLTKANVTSALGYTPLQTHQDITGKLDKTTYEYNLELRATGANSGQTILIGKFPCYDTNITIEISATTNTTYNGTLVIATQNIAPGATGVLNATVYGDANNTITPAINIERESISGSRIIAVYFKPQSYSKNLFHIQCQTPSAAPTDMMTWVSSVTAGEVRYTPVNALTANFNKYTLPTATSSALGGIKLGYTDSGKNYKVQVDGSGNAYVNVPWTDTNTTNFLPLAGGTLNADATIKLSTYGTRFLTLSGNSISADMSNETGGWAGSFASVKAPGGDTTTMLGWYGGASGLTHIFMGGTYSSPYMKMTKAGQFTFNTEVILNKVGTLKIPTASGGTTYGLGSAGQVLKTNGTTIYWGSDNNTTYSNATTSAAGLMSATDKTNLNTLVALLADNDTNTTVDTIREVLNVFASYPEGTTIANALAGKSDTGHQHGLADVNGLQSSLNSINGTLNSKADSQHSHEIADVEGLRLELDAKAEATDLGADKILMTQGNATSPTIYDYVTGQAQRVAALEEEVDAKMSKSGGEFTGPICFKSETALPSKTLSYICGIDAFASGGTMGWQSKDSFLSGYATHTWVTNQGYTKNTGTVTSVKVGTTSYSPSSGVVSLPAYPTVPTKTSQLTNDSNFSTFTGYTSSNKLSTDYINNKAGWTTNTGTVTSVKVGSTSYSPSSGVVSLPAYPTSLPASDVSSWAKASSKPSYTKSEVGLGNVLNVASYSKTEVDNLLGAKSKKEYGSYFVSGTQTASTNVWTGTNSDITALYDGLAIRYYLPYAGTSTGATLNINNLGAYPVFRYGRTTQITTHFAAGSIITMTFRTSYKVGSTSYTNAWIVDSFYDSNSYAYVRQYTTSTDAEYPVLFAYETALPSSYDTKYTRKNSAIKINPSTGTLSATSFTENGTALSNKYLKLSGGTVTGDVYYRNNWLGGEDENGDESWYIDSTVGSCYFSTVGGAVLSVNRISAYTSASSNTKGSGTDGQVLMTNGSNKVYWGNAGGGSGGIEPIANNIWSSTYTVNDASKYKGFIIGINGYSDMSKNVVLVRFDSASTYACSVYHQGGSDGSSPGLVDYVDATWSGDTATITNHAEYWGAWGIQYVWGIL